MPTLPRFLTLALWSVVSLSGPARIPPAAPGPLHAERGAPGVRCGGLADSLAVEWGATGAWRRLAPYPVPREASPTDSVGVWVERWTLENGETELQRVSAGETITATLVPDGCLHSMRTITRHYNADSLRGAFTDATLDSLVHASPNGLLYVWSPRMPLSVRGLAEARAAAATLGIAFTAVVADADRAEVAKLDVDGAFARPLQALELVYRNATIHYPALLVYRDGAIVDGVVPGYRQRDTYVQLARERLAQGSSAVPAAPVPTRSAVPPYWVDRNARVTTLATVNTVRRIGFFFKPITGTTLISYTAEDIAYLFDVTNGHEQRIPGHVDPVPTPDGRFMTLPGLHFHPVPSLVAGNNVPLYTDPELPDEYQTASILAESRGSLRYRVVTGWRDGARFRDYDVALDGKGQPTSVQPAGPAFVPCQGRQLTLPINAKSGREFGAYDLGTRSNVVLEVTGPAACTDKLDLGFASGKLSFSFDGASIAFATSRIDTKAEGVLVRPSELFHKDALVLFRKNARIVSLSDNEPLHGMTFPEFQKDGSVMLLDQAGPGRPVEVIRVVRIK